MYIYQYRRIVLDCIRLCVINDTKYQSVTSNDYDGNQYIREM